MTNPTPQDISPALAFVFFTKRIAVLVEEGIRLVDALSLLRDLPAPYGEEAGRLRQALDAGDTLSDAMLGQRDLYSRYYISCVSAGEVGGVLDITLRIAADIIAKEWRLMSRTSVDEALLVASPSTRNFPESWEQLTEYQRAVNQYLFCEMWGTMLNSGVPILRSMEVVGDLLPRQQVQRLHEAKVDIMAGKPINGSRFEMLPPFIAAMIDEGEATGRLDLTLLKAAETLEAELDALAATISIWNDTWWAARGRECGTMRRVCLVTNNMSSGRGAAG